MPRSSTARSTRERETARRVRALYDVSESFAQSLSLNATLDALARSAVELLGIDAAVIRMPDARGELLEQRSVYVADARLAEAAIPALTRPQTLDVAPMRRLFRTRRPLMLTPKLALELGASHRPLAPFLEKGSSVAVVPIAIPGEVIGTLTLVSFDPGRPIVRETLNTALSIAAQAALAIDNGRLYQQQKEFADTMRRSLLPRSHPELQGLEIGEVYAAGDSRRRRRRRLRLPRPRGRQARGRARGRHGPRNRGDRGHGDGEVRLPLARARASRPGRLSRFGE